MKRYTIGVDIGGTKCKIGLFKSTGELIEKWVIDTDTFDAGKHILDNIMNSISQRIHRHNISYDDIEGIGIGVPSPVTPNGIARESVNLGWHEYDVTFEMQQRTGLPVKIGNDVNVAALGELWKGSAVGCSNAIVITLGTGIGGGIVVSNQIVDGYDGSAGEVGHLIVNPNENEICACGRKGCLEQYASATGIVRMARRVLESSQKPSSLREIESLTAKDIFDYAKAGDQLASELVDEFGRVLGGALADMACVLNPEMIVIGGGVSHAGQIVIDVVQKYFRQKTLFTCTDTKFALARLGNDAGIYGAVKMLLTSQSL